LPAVGRAGVVDVEAAAGLVAEVEEGGSGGFVFGEVTREEGGGRPRRVALGLGFLPPTVGWIGAGLGGARAGAGIGVEVDLGANGLGLDDVVGRLGRGGG
jgi:hypothetical protein